AGRGPEEQSHAVQKGGLPTPGTAHYGDEFTSVDPEGDAVQGLDHVGLSLPVFPGQIVDLDCRHPPALRSPFYSARSARSGSSLPARSAGRMPAPTPSAAANPSTILASLSVTRKTSMLTVLPARSSRAASPAPRAKPITPPTIAMMVASSRCSTTMCQARAPN